MSALELVELDLAARLHDVGKIRVPGEILRKPAALSAGERQVIELHPTWGAELVGGIPGLQLQRSAGRQFDPQVVDALQREVAARPLTAHSPSALRLPATASDGGPLGRPPLALPART